MLLRLVREAGLYERKIRALSGVELLNATMR
jgi:hypothetical protein